MVQRTEIRLIDDLDGKEIPTGKGETVPFGLDGTSYEIDLGAKNAAALRRTLVAYVAAARPVKPPRGARRRRATDPDARQIKAWARENGYEVADRGRVPGHIRDAYHTAH
ncbi:Lsr2 protein [Kribbella orskensis]|uniref:Lsr2 protein n=1 Tax=Kribbella orskensis TaxID=2512216 RepID=A0ABY2B734_9ACTN|nr:MULTISPECIES: Lsr2 family protein [Kribbella]TCN29264.1 Lsr2 protein [Kribbella sp. VKM Ac-2500]TCO09551.1 Lsr2 protein [Kribbella orskensis]